MSSLTEKLLVSKDGKVKGQPDLVVETSKGWILYDYKTGKITEQLDEGEVVFKASYELQLRLYAGLLWQDRGIKIQEAYLVTEDGKTHSVVINIEDSERLLAEASELLNEFNESIPDTAMTFDQARPMPWTPAHKIAGCSGCTYRPICSAYSEVDRTPQDGAYWPKDTRGVIKSIEWPSESDAALLELEPAGFDIVKTIRISSRHRALRTVKKGDEIVIFDYVGTHSMKADGPRTCIYQYMDNPTEDWQLHQDILKEL